MRKKWTWGFLDRKPFFEVESFQDSSDKEFLDLYTGWRKRTSQEGERSRGAEPVTDEESDFLHPDKKIVWDTKEDREREHGDEGHHPDDDEDDDEDYDDYYRDDDYYSEEEGGQGDSHRDDPPPPSGHKDEPPPPDQPPAEEMYSPDGGDDDAGPPPAGDRSFGSEPAKPLPCHPEGGELEDIIDERGVRYRTDEQRKAYAAGIRFMTDEEKMEFRITSKTRADAYVKAERERVREWEAPWWRDFRYPRAPEYTADPVQARSAYFWRLAHKKFCHPYYEGCEDIPWPIPENWGREKRLIRGMHLDERADLMARELSRRCQLVNEESIILISLCERFEKELKELTLRAVAAGAADRSKATPTPMEVDEPPSSMAVKTAEAKQPQASATAGAAAPPPQEPKGPPAVETAAPKQAAEHIKITVRAPMELDAHGEKTVELRAVRVPDDGGSRRELPVFDGPGMNTADQGAPRGADPKNKKPRRDPTKPMQAPKAVGSDVEVLERTAPPKPAPEEVALCLVKAIKEWLAKHPNDLRSYRVKEDFTIPVEELWSEYVKGEKGCWAQFWKLPPLFVVLPKEKVLFTCTSCHSLVEELWKDTTMHVCVHPNVARDAKGVPTGQLDERVKRDPHKYNWHYVDSCLAVMCKKCTFTLRKKIFNPRPLGCINCRSTDFFNLEFQPVLLEAWPEYYQRENEPECKFQVEYEKYAKGNETQQPQAHAPLSAKSWDGMCNKGFDESRGTLAVEHTMVCLRQFLENEMDNYPYFKYKDLKPYQGGWRFNIVGKESDLGTLFPAGQTQREFQKTWVDVFRFKYAQAHFLYSRLYNTLYERALKGMHLAPQCPQNQPWRNWLIKPAYAPPEIYNIIRETCHMIRWALMEKDRPLPADKRRCGPYRAVFMNPVHFKNLGMLDAEVIFDTHLAEVREEIKRGKKVVNLDVDLYQAHLDRKTTEKASGEAKSVASPSGEGAPAAASSSYAGAAAKPAAAQAPPAARVVASDKGDEKGRETPETPEKQSAARAAAKQKPDTPAAKVAADKPDTSSVGTAEKGAGEGAAPAKAAAKPKAGAQAKDAKAPKARSQSEGAIPKAPAEGDDRATKTKHDRPLEVLGGRNVLPNFILSADIVPVWEALLNALAHPDQGRLKPPPTADDDKVALIALALYEEAWTKFEDGRYERHLKPTMLRVRNRAWVETRKKAGTLPLTATEENAHVHALCMYTEQLPTRNLPKRYRTEKTAPSERIREVFKAEPPYVAERILIAEGFKFPKQFSVHHRVEEKAKAKGKDAPAMWKASYDPHCWSIKLSSGEDTYDEVAKTAADVVARYKLAIPLVVKTIRAAWESA